MARSRKTPSCIAILGPARSTRAAGVAGLCVSDASRRVSGEHKHSYQDEHYPQQWMFEEVHGHSYNPSKGLESRRQPGNRGGAARPSDTAVAEPNGRNTSTRSRMRRVAQAALRVKVRNIPRPI
jgi:hypothetical protein